MTSWKVFVGLGVAVCVSGCSSSTDGEDPKKCPETDAAVSFETEVLPIMRRACGISSSCHGLVSGSQAELYLGPKLSAPDPTAAERTALIAGLVGVPSKTAPAMNLITAGDPSQSFLMHKMDDTHNDQNLTCSAQPGAESGQPCGDSMPQGSPLLDACERDLFRRWIAQGAADN